MVKYLLGNLLKLTMKLITQIKQKRKLSKNLKKVKRNLYGMLLTKTGRLIKAF